MLIVGSPKEAIDLHKKVKGLMEGMESRRAKIQEHLEWRKTKAEEEEKGKGEEYQGYPNPGTRGAVRGRGKANKHLVGGGNCKIANPVRTFVFRSSKNIYINIRDFCCHTLILVIVKEAVSSRPSKLP